MLKLLIQPKKSVKFPFIKHIKRRVWKRLRTSKLVCFIILAGGKNIRYDLKQSKQCDPLLQFPSKPSLIQIFLKKFQALGKLINTLIHIYIVVNDEQRKKKIRKIKSHKIPNSEHLSIDFLTQINYGCLDHSGKLIVTDQNQVFMHPNGNGDLWANFQGKNYEKTGLNQFKYFQIFGVSNMLEHCFDCYMIGKLVAEQLHWVTMTKNNRQFNNCQPVIFVNNDKKIHVRDPEEIGAGMDLSNLAYFPQKCPHVFLGNTVFSAQFIQNAISSKSWASHRKYHCKQKKIDYRPPLSRYSSIFVFQRQLTDIFALTQQISIQKGLKSQKEAIFIMKQEQYSSPYFFKFDQVVGIVTLSEIYKEWLKINKKNSYQQDKDKQFYEEKLKQICQIDPFISLEGENLQEIVEELSQSKQPVQYPFYVGPETSEHFSQMTTTMKESKFQKLNQLA